MIKKNWVKSFAVAGSLIMSSSGTRPQTLATPQPAASASQPIQPKTLQAARACIVQAMHDDDAKHRLPFMDMSDTVAGSFSYTGHNIDSAKTKTRSSFTISKNETFTITVASDDLSTQAILFGTFDDHSHVVTSKQELSYDPGMPRNANDEQKTRFHADNLFKSFQGCLTLKLS